jgi:hypothetical protein
VSQIEQSAVRNRLLASLPPTDFTLLAASLTPVTLSLKQFLVEAAILNLHERIENKLFLDRTRKDSNSKRPHICATLFQIEKCCRVARDLD